MYIGLIVDKVMLVVHIASYSYASRIIICTFRENRM